MLFLFIVMGGLEWVRTQILIVTSTRLDVLLAGRVFDAVFALTLASGGRVSSAQPLSDLLQIRQFLTGPGLFAFFDAPWFPLYLGVMFLFHPLFGAVGLISAFVLAGLAFWNEAATREHLQEANRHAIESNQFTERNLRNAEVIEAMGMLPSLRTRWQDKQTLLLALQNQASTKGGLITVLAKIYRLTIQSLILGLGAYLAIHREITPGLVIAGSILLGRALAPLDLMINAWRGFLQARASYQRLDDLLEAIPSREPPMPLPAPQGAIHLENAFVQPLGAAAPVLKGINLAIEPGSPVGVIGPSASGKSTLVRAILGIYPTLKGAIRLDGAETTQWDREALGRYIGYLPQDVELLDGSISENIARFGTIEPDRVVAAARAAGIHDMIVRLPEGYDTKIIGHGYILSAGQRQRLGLARAVFGEPKVVILDEPNSNLDQDGENALLAALAELKRSGCTVIVITHRKKLLSQVDRIVLLVDGEVALSGTRDQVLASLQSRPASGYRPAAAVPIRNPPRLP